MYFLNSIAGKNLVQHYKTDNHYIVVEANESAYTKSDSTSSEQFKKSKRANPENYLPNVSILSYIVQKGVESLPVYRLKDFIPFSK